MAASALDTQNVLLLGDSFINRLKEWAFINGKLNLNLDSSRVAVHWEALGGMHANRDATKSVWHYTASLAKTNPKVVLLSIGSNDLGVHSVSPETVKNRIIEFVAFCVQQGADKVIVLELLPRNRQYASFNHKISAVNNLLKEEASVRNAVYLWEHSRQKFNERFLDDFVDSDGVHMNPRGLVKFYMSVRGAVLWAENQCESQSQ